jgi:hypothetical protein
MEKKIHIEKQGYTYSCIWECEFDRNIREDAKIKRFVDSIDIVTPGGRTLHLISPSYVDRSPKFSITIFGCPRTVFPVLLIYGYSEVTS